MKVRASLAACYLVLVCGLLSLAGCNTDPNQPVGISGKVTWGGEPLPQGNLTLTPITTGSATGGEIKNGEFNIPAENGVVPGTYKVMIEAYLPTGRKVPNSNKPGEMADELRQMIPPRYNHNTELQAEVTRDGENVFTYDLEKPSR